MLCKHLEFKNFTSNYTSSIGDNLPHCWQLYCRLRLCHSIAWQLYSRREEENNHLVPAIDFISLQHNATVASLFTLKNGNKSFRNFSLSFSSACPLYNWQKNMFLNERKMLVISNAITWKDFGLIISIWSGSLKFLNNKCFWTETVLLSTFWSINKVSGIQERHMPQVRTENSSSS